MNVCDEPATPPYCDCSCSSRGSCCQKLESRDGDMWNVISSKWWVKWKDYSGYKEEGEEDNVSTNKGGRKAAKGGRRSGKSSPQGGKKASVADENDDDEDDDGYGRGRERAPPPGKINNSDLLILG
jgi:hypothetical protein